MLSLCHPGVVRIVSGRSRDSRPFYESRPLFGEATCSGILPSNEMVERILADDSVL